MSEPLMILPRRVEQVLERLEKSGYEAYAVGGCVRDAMLGRIPNDWDVTTSALPEQTAACFADCRVVETGIQHGTVTVIFDGMPLEITTFRSDGEYQDHRHPLSVTFAARVEEDLSRRDFTVNAMAYNPRRGLVDLFGGREDLAAGRIACVGEAERRFDEDGLRILRALRFAAVLGFSIEASTANAVRRLYGLLEYIAPERIREELCKLLCGAGAAQILREYPEVVKKILPELGECMGFDQNTQYHCYDVYEHTLHALDIAKRDLVTRWAILLHDAGKPLCYTEDERGGHFYGHAEKSAELAWAVMKRLRFDNATANAVVRLVEYHQRPLSAEEPSVKRLMQKMSDEDILRLLEIQRCDRLACAPDHRCPNPALENIPAVLKQIRERGDCLSLRTLAVKGTDLMSQGIPTGKALGEILNYLLEQVVDGKLPNRRENLLAAAKKRWASMENRVES
jgi:tRNA nucleotidyltransferase (CCA-adding enzyme)